MATQQDKLKELAENTAKKKAEIERTVYYDDFEKAFKKLISAVDKAKTSLNETVGQNKQEITQQIKQAINNINIKAENLSKLHQQAVNDLKSDQRTFQRLIDDKLREMNDSLPDDYDDELILADIRTLKDQFDNLIIPPKFDATELSSQVDKNTEDIEELKKRPVGSGGGVTNARIQQAFKYILKTESPTGDIDGVNTDYTVSQPIFAVFAFSLNGETIAQIPNYTISGNSISFSTPLPAVYAGKDFEIKYI